MQVTINRRESEVPERVTIAELLAQRDVRPEGVAVAVNMDIVPREEWATRAVRPGDEVEVIRIIQGGALHKEGAPPGEVLPRRAPSRETVATPEDLLADDPLVIGGVSFSSRLLCGTGKFASAGVAAAALEAAGTELVTVAIRYVDPDDPASSGVLQGVDLARYKLLPNTAGAVTAEHAVRMARLARAATGTNFIKLEVIGDAQYLWPDVAATVEATKQLVKEGFVVLPYTSPDLVAALRLEEAGAATVMPLASPIGSGQGYNDWVSIERICRKVRVPVVVDAGIRSPSDAALAMELGAAAVLVNTAIAKAKEPVRMARAMRLAVVAGRLGHRAGRIVKREEAEPSSPSHGVPMAPS